MIKKTTQVRLTLHCDYIKCDSGIILEDNYPESLHSLEFRAVNEENWGRITNNFGSHIICPKCKVENN